MRSGVVAQKVGMTRVFTEAGEHVPVTVLRLAGCQVIAHRTKDRPALVIGFAAETEKLRQHAQSKRLRKGVPLLAANIAQQALGSDENELLLFDDEGEHRLARAPKLALARALLTHAHRLMSNRR